MSPSLNHQHHMYMPTSGPAATATPLNPANQTENLVDNFLNSHHHHHHLQNNSASNSIGIPNNITVSIPTVQLKNIDDYQMMSNNLAKQELTADFHLQHNNPSTNPTTTTIPKTNLNQINNNNNNDQLTRKASIPQEVTTKEEDENDIFELMEDLKSELKFTFEEEGEALFPDASMKNTAVGVVNSNQITHHSTQPSIMNHPTAPGVQFVIDPNSHQVSVDFQPTNNTNVGAINNNGAPTYTTNMENVPNYMNNVLPNGGAIPSLNDFNNMMFQETPIPNNLMQMLPPHTANNIGNLGSLDQVPPDMKLYLQAQQQNMYMLNSNNFYSYPKNCDPNLASQYNLATNGNVPSNHKQMSSNHFYYAQQRQHQPSTSTGHYLNSHMAPHVKKPLNAFMLYMKDVRPKLIKETNTKDSIAINKIIGKMWQSLSKDEQAKYFEMARNEREIHRQLYPNYTTCDQYIISKKKRRKRDKALHDEPLMKKCRARFGLDNQDKWCKPCRRKKKCIRFLHDDDQLNMPNNVVDTGNYNSGAKNSYRNNYAKLATSPPKSLSDDENIDDGIDDNDQVDHDNATAAAAAAVAIQETLNSTVISPSDFSIATSQQHQLQQQQQNLPSDYSNNLGTNNFSPNLINERDNKFFNNDSLFPLSNTTTTSTFNESLVDLLSNISPIPFKHDSIPPDTKVSSYSTTKSNPPVKNAEKDTKTTDNSIHDDKNVIFVVNPTTNNNNNNSNNSGSNNNNNANANTNNNDGFETNFNLNDSDVFKLEDIENQNITPNTPPRNDDKPDE